MNAKKRTTVPNIVSAKLLFMSDRTCCVCHTKGKPVQIHHLDEDPSNNVIDNLAVLCLDCHNETMVKGGFHKKLNSDQIILYRDDWNRTVYHNRAIEKNQFSKTQNDIEKNSFDIELATSIAEIYRENKEYELLALHYINIGNKELADKYIDKVIANGIDDVSHIFFRSIQNDTQSIPKEILEKRIRVLERHKNYSELGRLYRALGFSEKDVENICLYALSALNKKNTFSTAFYLKEMVTEGAIDKLFIIALENAKKEKDLWWEFRSLQELGWNSEIDSFFKRNKKHIFEIKDELLIREYYLNKGDWEKYSKLKKKHAKKSSMMKTFK